jgi:glycosyltransferase involved in cell wall biosynthesis
MNILHTISGLEITSGGPSLSTWTLINGLRQIDVDAHILTFSPKMESLQMIGNGSFVHALDQPTISMYKYASSLKTFLKHNPYDLYQANGLWEYPTHAVARFARNHNKPYIISPRGMLYPEALKTSHWFKKLALPIYQRKDLDCANLIHATCIQEKEYIRALGFQNPIAVVPNALVLNVPYPIKRKDKIKKQFGFLGRFAPIKNLESLIQAWSLTGAQESDWELVLIGDGDAKYKHTLEGLTKRLGINNIRFCGFLQGAAKEIALQNLDFLILPSLSENFGMVVPEALWRNIPVIASKGTPWDELVHHEAGWWVDTDVVALATAIEIALRLPESERQRLGNNGKKLVEERYGVKKISSQMIQVYEWVLGDNSKPDFVYE